MFIFIIARHRAHLLHAQGRYSVSALVWGNRIWNIQIIASIFFASAIGLGWNHNFIEGDDFLSGSLLNEDYINAILPLSSRTTSTAGTISTDVSGIFAFMWKRALIHFLLATEALGFLRNMLYDAPLYYNNLTEKSNKTLQFIGWGSCFLTTACVIAMGMLFLLVGDRDWKMIGTERLLVVSSLLNCWVLSEMAKYEGILRERKIVAFFHKKETSAMIKAKNTMDWLGETYVDLEEESTT